MLCIATFDLLSDPFYLKSHPVIPIIRIPPICPPLTKNIRHDKEYQTAKQYQTDKAQSL